MCLFDLRSALNALKLALNQQMKMRMAVTTLDIAEERDEIILHDADGDMMSFQPFKSIRERWDASWSAHG